MLDTMFTSIIELQWQLFCRLLRYLYTFEAAFGECSPKHRAFPRDRTHRPVHEILDTKASSPFPVSRELYVNPKAFKLPFALVNRVSPIRYLEREYLTT